MKKIFLILFLLFSSMTIIRLLGEGSGGGIWNIFQIIFVILGLITLLGNGIRSADGPVKSLVTYSLYILFLSFFGLTFTVESLYYFLIAPYAGMLLYLMYYFADKSTYKGLPILSIMFFYVLAYIVYTKNNYSMLIDEVYMGINSYYLVCFLPLLLIFHKKYYKVIPFIVTFFIVLSTNKRAGFIAISLMLLYFILRNTKRKSFLYVAVISITICYVVIFLYENIIDTSNSFAFFERLFRIQEDGGSGRDVMWRSLLSSLNESSVWGLLFGHGAASVSKLLGHAAHNDFLQILYDYGAIACVMYIVFYVKLVKQAIYMRRSSYRYAIYYELSIISSLVFSMFSFFIIEPRFVGCSLITWGVILSDFQYFKLTGESKFKNNEE